MELIGSMLKHLFYSIAILLNFQSLVYAEPNRAPRPADELLGDWRLVQTYCSDIKTQSVEATRIMKMPWFGFEPNVQLRVFETASGKNIEKVVPKSSCSDNEVATTHFIRSTYAVNTETTMIHDQKVHTVTSKGIVAKNVNEEALKQCGGTIKGFILNTVVSNFIYPDYFEQEARRKYDFKIKDGHLFVIFNEPMICENGQTIMIFGRYQ